MSFFPVPQNYIHTNVWNELFYEPILFLTLPFTGKFLERLFQLNVHIYSFPSYLSTHSNMAISSVHSTETHLGKFIQDLQFAKSKGLFFFFTFLVLLFLFFSFYHTMHFQFNPCENSPDSHPPWFSLCEYLHSLLLYLAIRFESPTILPQAFNSFL